MSILIIAFGVLILLAGITIIINPENLFDLLKTSIEKLELHILAVVVRLLLGALLIYQAGISKYPLAIEIIGWLSIFAAVIFTVIGRNNFIRLMSWALSLTKPFGRIGGVLAVCFGAFLIYAFI
jgi:hypothetical protein